MIVFYFFFMRRTAKIASATEKMKPAAAISGMPFAVWGRMSVMHRTRLNPRRKTPEHTQAPQQPRRNRRRLFVFI